VIALVGVEELDRVMAHVARLWAMPDVPRSRPYGNNTPLDPEPRKERLRVAWGKSISEPGWQRTWALYDGDRIVGHCDLKGGQLASELHRATLGIAIEEGHRDRGNGRAMCGAAIAWAKQQGLAWIDLGVFGGNARAAALYRKLGFVEVGVVRDRFRVDTESIDDISMTLAL
jgi:RimJ/RimL family protein N-acetyltransferase